MAKYSFLFFLLVIMIGCQDTQPKVTETAQEPTSFSIQDYPKLLEFEQDVQSSVNSWPEFMAMENSFDVLKRASNTEDLKLAIDDLIEKEKALASSNYPEAFDKLQIKSRQQVFRTFLFKVKGNLLDSRDINEAMEELIVAYNAYKYQFNVIVSTTLDAKLILDEE